MTKLLSTENVLKIARKALTANNAKATDIHITKVNKNGIELEYLDLTWVYLKSYELGGLTPQVFAEILKDAQNLEDTQSQTLATKVEFDVLPDWLQEELADQLSEDGIANLEVEHNDVDDWIMEELTDQIRSTSSFYSISSLSITAEYKVRNGKGYLEVEIKAEHSN